MVLKVLIFRVPWHIAQVYNDIGRGDSVARMSSRLLLLPLHVPVPMGSLQGRPTTQFIQTPIGCICWLLNPEEYSRYYIHILSTWSMQQTCAFTCLRAIFSVGGTCKWCARLKT